VADICQSLDTSFSEARRIMHEYGHCYTTLADDPEFVVEIAGGRKQRMSRSELGGIVQPRLEEILEQVRLMFEGVGGGATMPAGIVLTGGVSRLPGLVGLAEQVFAVPVRLGVNRGLEGLTGITAEPGFSGAVGLAVDNYQRQREFLHRDVVTRIIDGAQHILNKIM